MAPKTNYMWDEETGVMLCEIEYRGKIYKGIAVCHEDDKDFKSELVGGELALQRAYIKMFKDLKKEERKKYNNFKHLYDAMSSSYKFNPDSFEAKMIRKSMYRTKADIEALDTIIDDIYTSIKRQITTNDDFFNKVRLKRQKATIPN